MRRQIAAFCVALAPFVAAAQPAAGEERYLVQARLGDTVKSRVIAVGGAPGRVARFHWTDADTDG